MAFFSNTGAELFITLESTNIFTKKKKNKVVQKPMILSILSSCVYVTVTSLVTTMPLFSMPESTPSCMCLLPPPAPPRSPRQGPLDAAWALLLTPRGPSPSSRLRSLSSVTLVRDMLPVLRVRLRLSTSLGSRRSRSKRSRRRCGKAAAMMCYGRGGKGGSHASADRPFYFYFVSWDTLIYMQHT